MCFWHRSTAPGASPASGARGPAEAVPDRAPCSGRTCGLGTGAAEELAAAPTSCARAAIRGSGLLTLSPVSQAVEPQSTQSALSCLSGPNCIRLLRQLNVTALSACGVLCCALQCALRRQRRLCASGWCRHCVWGLWVRSPQAPIPPQADRSRSARGASTTRRSWRLITGEGDGRGGEMAVVDVGCPTECLSVSLHSLEPAPLLPLPPFVPHTPDWFVSLPLVIANTAIAAALAIAATG